MPFVVPFIPLIAAGIGGTELGLKLSGAGQPSPHEALGQQQQLLKQQQAKQAKADAEARQKSILASLADAQGQSGGFLDKNSLVDLASIIAGLPGEATRSTGQGALNQYLGINAAPPSSGDNVVSATYGLSGGQGG